MTAHEFLAEQGRLADAATPGPWEIEIDNHRCYLEDESDCERKSSPITERSVFRVAAGDLEDAVSHVHESYEAHQIGPDVAGNYDYEEGGIIHTADAEFIAASRSSVPRMVKALEAVLALEEQKAYRGDSTLDMASVRSYNRALREAKTAITAALEGEETNE